MKREYALVRPVKRAAARILDAVLSPLSHVFRKQVPEPRSVKRALVIVLDHLGDVVLSTPAIAEVRRVHPGARITVLTGAWGKEALLGSPEVDEVKVFDAPWFRRSPEGRILRGGRISGVRRLAHIVADLGPDIVYELRGDARHILACRLAHARAVVGTGPTGLAPLLSVEHPYSPEEHTASARWAVAGAARKAMAARFAVERRADQRTATPAASSALPAAPPSASSTSDSSPASSSNSSSFSSRSGSSSASPGDDISNLQPSWVVTPKERQLARELVGEKGGYLVAHPGAGTDRKLWPAECWARLIDGLAEDGWRVVLTGSGSESALAEDIAERCTAEPGPMNLAGRTSLRTLAAVIGTAGMYVGGDTGPTHIAAATGTPTVALFGFESHPKTWAPLGRSVMVLTPRSGHTPEHPMMGIHLDDVRSAVCWMKALSRTY